MPPHPSQPSSSRLIPVDALRGLIVIFMALDHASYFIARVHLSDWWGIPLPRYSSSLAFLTRFVTHPCAPGFFFLLGLSIVLFAESRRRLGWPDGRIRRYFLRRGLILIGLQFFAENIAWALIALRETPPGDTGPFFVYLGVLFALGTSMIICGRLLRLRTSILVAAGAAAVLLTQFLTPGSEDVSRLYHPFLRAILIPGQTGVGMVKYPIIPWLGVALLGMALGRKMVRDPKGAFRLAFLFGAGALVLFPVVRLIGWPVGDFHPPRRSRLGRLSQPDEVSPEPGLPAGDSGDRPCSPGVPVAEGGDPQAMGKAPSGVRPHGPFFLHRSFVRFRSYGPGLPEGRPARLDVSLLDGRPCSPLFSLLLVCPV